jgi:hypothetical protein
VPEGVEVGQRCEIPPLGPARRVPTSVFDPSLYSDEEREIIVRALNNIAVAVDARRKFGVEKNGLTLLLALNDRGHPGRPDKYEYE